MNFGGTDIQSMHSQADLRQGEIRMVRALMISLMVFATLGGPAKADEACVGELNKLVHDWRAIAVPGGPA